MIKNSRTSTAPIGAKPGDVMDQKDQKYTPMLGRAHALMLAGHIPTGAYNAVHRLMDLRRPTGLHRLIDPVAILADSFPLRPSDEIERRHIAVRYAKSNCIVAGVPRWAVDYVFPEEPRVDIMPRESIVRRVTDHIGWRIALWRERQNDAAHMDGV